jgi:molybdopterin/thiamine biosynthesis adenylyltransferase
LSKRVLEITHQDMDDRFARFKLIQWWNQELISGARILVIGAGALGNEIVKNLSLLGVGRVFIADMDRIENSNLSRSVLFRASHNGQEKARVAGISARDLFPGQKVQSFTGNVIYDLGMGVFRWADLVMAGLDNREARLHVSRQCWRTGTPYIDGAIEGINGMARVFLPPDSSCYECTMNETDWKELHNRRSCNLLSVGEMELGKVPTTPTISSIIAGIQCQELLKILHGLKSMSGEGFVFNGMTMDSYTIAYPRRENCMSHEVYDTITEMDWSARTMTIADALSFIKGELGKDAVLELNNDVLVGFSCPQCNRNDYLFKSLGVATVAESACPRCGNLRVPRFTHIFDGSEDFLYKTLIEIGVPPFDVITGREGMNQIFLELSGDRDEVLDRVL